jgi:predicted DNA-binding transcriptional regulator AlpA
MHPFPTLDPILSPETLAAEWGISLVTLWRTRKRDPSFPQPVRWGRKLGWRRSSVIRWLDEQEASAANLQTEH